MLGHGGGRLRVTTLELVSNLYYRHNMMHRDVVRKAFAGQAHAFEDTTRHFKTDEVMEWLATNTPTSAGDIVLEVAAGTGIYARAIADGVAAVVVVDVTLEMLAEGKRVADSLGVRNIVAQEGDATNLPFLANSFDRVLSRLAIHHFEDPTVPIKEMVRVCRPGGTITIVDMVVVDESTQTLFNDLERRRDPSHTWALTRSQLRSAIKSTECSIGDTATRVNVLDAQRWLDQTSTPSDEAEVIRSAWNTELAGSTATGMAPFVGPAGIGFVHHWDLIVATKSAEVVQP